jgi:hypothetical protein
MGRLRTSSEALGTQYVTEHREQADYQTAYEKIGSSTRTFSYRTYMANANLFRLPAVSDDDLEHAFMLFEWLPTRGIN